MSPRRISVSIAILLCLAVAQTAAAQPAASRVEVGVQTTFLNLSDSRHTNTGIGGRVTFDLTPWLAVEAAGEFFPSDDLLQSSTTPDALGIRYERKRADGFFGVKAGKRTDRFGLFVKARPGFTRLTNRGVECIGEVCALSLLAVPEYRTEVALDLGGVVEFYPSARTVARFDVGDTMIRHRSSAPPCWGSGCTSHNLTSRVGLGLRF